jgi:hypothetical protein
MQQVHIWLVYEPFAELRKLVSPKSKLPNRQSRRFRTF